MKEKARQFAVLGLGVFGSSVAKTLSSFGCEVLAIDQDIKCVERVAEYVTHAVQGDITQPENLRECGVDDCDVAIVGIGTHLEESVMAIINCKDLGVPYVVAKAKNKRYMQIMLTVGADKVVRPEKETGERIAKSLLSRHIVDTIDIDGDYTMSEILTPERWAGRTLRQLDIRAKYGITVLGVRGRMEAHLRVSPDPDYRLQTDDHLLVLADNQSLGTLMAAGV